MRIRLSSALFFLMSVFAFCTEISCRKEKKILTSGGELRFSDDTLKFDTVFTAAGSFTTGILIYNPQNQDIVLSSVRMQNSNSYFSLNVDGFKGSNVTDIRIAPRDSVYVFATVNIDPNDKRTPFVVTDSLVATLNGRNFYVPFTAYGQNARYIIDSVIRTNVIWDTTLPYVIINSMGIATGASLTLNPGCRVYMHQNSGVVVFGKLICNGTARDSVIFQGDRLDRRYFGYEGYPGEWGGIYFHSTSSGSRLRYTRLENCGNGALGNPAAIWTTIDSNAASAEPQVRLENCIIKNSIGTGIYAQKSKITATNCLIHSTGGYALAIIQGGHDTFTNCTFANYGGTGLSHSTQGTVAILNFYRPDQNTIYYGDLYAAMRNCIVYGSLDSEIVCSAAPGAAAMLEMDHCLLKMGSVRESFIRFNNCIFNQDPLFANTDKEKDFRLKTGSPAIGKGNTSVAPITDITGRLRSGSVDIGCYQTE
jgi:hypothetical protein